MAPQPLPRSAPLKRATPSNLTRLGLLALTLPLCCACLCWRGHDKVSEAREVLARATRNNHTAHISYTRTNGYRKQSADQWFKDDFRTTIERFDLYTNARADRPAHVSDRLLAHQSNRKGNIHFEDPGAQLDISPQGDRILYKLSHEPAWRLLFLVGESWLLASDEMVSQGAAGQADWSKMPTFEQVAFPLYLAHDDSGPLGQSLLGKETILRHILATRGEEELSRFILELLDAPPSSGISSYHTEQAITLLSEQGREALADELIASLDEDLARGEVSGLRVNLLLELRPASHPSIASRSARLTEAFIQRSKRGELFYTHAIASLLLQAGREEIEAGQELACRMLTARDSELAHHGKEGRFIRLAALTVIATSGKSCPIVATMFHPDEGNNWQQFGYIHPQTGRLYTREELAPLIAQEFTNGPPDTAYHRTRVDGQFILAALLMTGQPLPR